MIKVNADTGLRLDEDINNIQGDEDYICLGTTHSCLSVKIDEMLGLIDDDNINWKSRTDYTGYYLPYYLNYFMVHICDGYLQSGGY